MISDHVQKQHIPNINHMTVPFEPASYISALLSKQLIYTKPDNYLPRCGTLFSIKRRTAAYNSAKFCKIYSHTHTHTGFTFTAVGEPDAIDQ